MLSGFIGAGGGCHAPFMSLVQIARARAAVATQRSAGFPIAFANTLGYLFGPPGECDPAAGTVGYDTPAGPRSDRGRQRADGTARRQRASCDELVQLKTRLRTCFFALVYMLFKGLQPLLA